MVWYINDDIYRMLYDLSWYEINEGFLLFVEYKPKTEWNTCKYVDILI